MAKVLVLYYSSCGHIETTAYAVAQGARDGGRRYRREAGFELVAEEVAHKSICKLEQKVPIASRRQNHQCLVDRGTQWLHDASVYSANKLAVPALTQAAAKEYASDGIPLLVTARVSWAQIYG